jgi:S-disulfanyl-L-cysteine oxidoreductase SoxD
VSRGIPRGLTDRVLNFLTLLFLASLATGPATAQAAQKDRTVLDGVYSAKQAAQGQAAYTVDCASCHFDDLSAYRGVLHGVAFLENFEGDPLGSLFQVIKRTMPRDDPGSLDDKTYLDIIAYILQVNLYPSGSRELTLDNFQNIKIVSRTGSETVANFALVTVVGCLEPGSDHAWTLTHATAPAKTRDPDAPSPRELLAYKAVALGQQKFLLPEAATYFQPDLQKGSKVVARGFLIRQPDGNKINLTSLQPLTANCGN